MVEITQTKATQVDFHLTIPSTDSCLFIQT